MFIIEQWSDLADLVLDTSAYLTFLFVGRGM